MKALNFVWPFTRLQLIVLCFVIDFLRLLIFARKTLKFNHLTQKRFSQILLNLHLFLNLIFIRLRSIVFSLKKCKSDANMYLNNLLLINSVFTHKLSYFSEQLVVIWSLESIPFRLWLWHSYRMILNTEHRMDS